MTICYAERMIHVVRERLLVNLAVDLVILTIRERVLRVLVVERGTDPFEGQLALPGGFLRGDEVLDATAARELHEETGLDPSALHLEQVRVYSEPGRDPRDPRVVTCSYLAIVPDLPMPSAGSDATAARWESVDDLMAKPQSLAFDHNEILADAVELARTKLQLTTIATSFCEPEFTISELREVYEAVWGIELDPPNFHRKVTDAEGFVVATDRKRLSATGRPATLYRAGDASTLIPPMIRSRTKTS